MRKRLLSFFLAAWLCTLTMTACSAAEVPAVDGGGEAEPLASGSVQAAGFSDVPGGVWYAGAVEYCRQHGVMGGTSETTFEPEGTLTRGMLVTVLHRMSGTPAVSDPPVFTDAAAGSWYSGAVAWAAKSGVISGYGGGVFGVNDPTTREQAVAILWRYAGSPESGAAESVSDAASVSGWAREAVRWADAGGILDGMLVNRRFDPQTNIKRGEVASMLYHYLTASANNSERKIILSVGGQRFEAVLYDTPAAAALWEQLPLTVTMQELNGNEKYHYLSDSLPTDASRPEKIQTGDLMLFGSDCLVLFYQSFTTSYSYTPLGRLTDPDGLAQALGGGSVEITFQCREDGPGDIA